MPATPTRCETERKHMYTDKNFRVGWRWGGGGGGKGERRGEERVVLEHSYSLFLDKC